MADSELPDITEAQLAALLDAGCAVQGLTLDPAWRPSILGHLSATSAAARLVLDFALDDAVEPAPVFRA